MPKPSESTIRILYVDDHQDTCEIMLIMLEHWGYEPTTAAGVAEALQISRANRFDLYILDNWLPDGSGLDLCRQIRAFDPQTPILFYSAAAYPSDVKEAKSAGAQGYLSKPCDLEQFEQAVVEMLKKRSTKTF